MEPTTRSCWRVSFRYYLEQGKEGMGFMLQVEEPEKGLGAGQMIETTMAKEVGLKVFRTYAEDRSWRLNNIQKISAAVRQWYQGGCRNNQLENVYIGVNTTPNNPRPKYEE